MNIKIKNYDFKNIKKRYTYIQAKTNELIHLYFFL